MALSSLQIKMIRRLIHLGGEAKIAHAIEKIHPSDLSILFSELNPTETERLINSLFLVAKAGRTLRELPEFMIPDILELMDNHKIAQMITRLEPDDAIFLLEKVPEDHWQTILDQVPQAQRQIIDRLLLYPPETAGGMMTSNFVKVDVGMTVDEAVESLRKQPETSGVFYIYVVDESNRLVGVQSLRNLVISPHGTKVRDIMSQDVHSVLAIAHQEEVAQKVAQYNLMAMPVVNEKNELLGVITADDVIDIIEEEATEDIYNLAGLSEADRAITPLSIKIKKRLPWMILSLFTTGLAAVVVGIFQKAIQEFVALAVFMPIIAAVGGTGAIQSLTVITRSIALGELSFIKIYKAIIKEGTSGLVVGIVCGLLMGIVGFLWKGNIVFAITIFVAMIFNLFIGGLTGAFIPIAFKRLNLDPAVGTSVIVIMVTDMIGFGLFLGFASMMMKHLIS